MTDYLNTKEYFGNSYWGQWYWGGIGVLYREVFRAVLRMNVSVQDRLTLALAVATSASMVMYLANFAKMSTEVDRPAIVDRGINETYDELEKIE